MKKLVSILLVLCMFVPLVLSASAVDTADSIHCEVLFSHESEDGTVEELTLVGEVLYFYLAQQDICKCVTYNRSVGYLGYVEYETGSDSFRQSKRNVSQALTEEDLRAYAYAEPTEILQSTPVSSVMRPVQPENEIAAYVYPWERTRILNKLYSSQYPREYTNENTRVYVAGSVPVEMKDTVSYEISATTGKRDFVKDITLDLVSTFLFKPVSILITFIKHYFDSKEYRLAEATRIQRFTVNFEKIKKAYINGVAYTDTWYRTTSTVITQDTETESKEDLIYEDGAYDRDYYDERKVAEIAAYYYEHGLGPYPA